MAHHKDVCEYGFTHGQCRCIGEKVTRRVGCNNQAHYTVMRTGAEWNALYPVRILNADGWDGEVSFDLTPITLDDFTQRLGYCTVESLGDKNWPKIRYDLRVDGHRHF